MPSEACGRGAAIAVQGLGKDYRIFANPRDRFLQIFSRRPRYQVHRALEGVEFRVAPGEVVGILGRNGSGKSTLLQILSGVLKPSSGSFQAQGRLAALLELGAGFNPEFTGLENLRINAAILGLSNREIEARLPEIAAFADIGDFLERPVKLYSSGMYVRLAFAVASSVEPDILIIDEALAVGDVQFQTKCFRRFEELVQRGCTVLLVTHSTEQVVRHCNRALLLEGGRLIADGEPRAVSNQYLELMFGIAPKAAQPTAAPSVIAPESDDQGVSMLEQRAGYFTSEYRWGIGTAVLEDVRLSRSGEVSHTTTFESGESVEIVIRGRFQRPRAKAIFGLFIKTPDGVIVYGNSTRNAPVYAELLAVGADETVCIAFAVDLNLGPGSYLLSVGIAVDEENEIIPLDRRYDCMHFEVFDDSGAVGLTNLRATARRL